MTGATPRMGTSCSRPLPNINQTQSPPTHPKGQKPGPPMRYGRPNTSFYCAAARFRLSASTVQDILLTQILRPPVCRRHRHVQLTVGIVQPRWPSVVKVSQGTFLQLRCCHPRRIQPVLPQLVQLPSRLCYGLPLLVSRFREWECFEAGGGGVAKPDSTSRSCVPIPLPTVRVNARQHTKRVVIFATNCNYRAIRQCFRTHPSKQTVLRNPGRSIYRFLPWMALRSPGLISI